MGSRDWKAPRNFLHQHMLVTHRDGNQHLSFPPHTADLLLHCFLPLCSIAPAHGSVQTFVMNLCHALEDCTQELWVRLDWHRGDSCSPQDCLRLFVFADYGVTHLPLVLVRQRAALVSPLLAERLCGGFLASYISMMCLDRLPHADCSASVG